MLKQTLNEPGVFYFLVEQRRQLCHEIKSKSCSRYCVRSVSINIVIVIRFNEMSTVYIVRQCLLVPAQDKWNDFVCNIAVSQALGLEDVRVIVQSCSCRVSLLGYIARLNIGFHASRILAFGCSFREGHFPIVELFTGSRPHHLHGSVTSNMVPWFSFY